MEKGPRECTDGLGQSGAATAEAERALRYRFEVLSFGVNKNRRYHDMLWGFFGRWRDRMKVVTAIAGSGAFLLVTAKAQPFAEVLSAFVALWAVLDIIVSPDKKADKHRDLCERFSELAAKIERADQTSESSLGDLTAERIMIERDELPTKRLVDLQARNDECRSRSYPPANQVPLSDLQRWAGYYLTFGMRRLEDWKQRQQASPN